MPTPTAARTDHDGYVRLARECARAAHHPMCDSDLCHPGCSYRAAAEVADYPFPGCKR